MAFLGYQEGEEDRSDLAELVPESLSHLGRLQLAPRRRGGYTADVVQDDERGA